MSAALPPDFFNRPLAEVDPEIAEVLALELERQQQTLEMIASENFAPLAVLECQGSVLSNKYAEGYPGKRYYGGCEYVDVAEQLAIDRAKSLFGAEHANVQPHAGAQANAAVYHALLQPGDTLMGLELSHGGHLTHGMKINVSGRLYEIVAYHVDRETSLIDMDEVERLAYERRPKMIVAGWSAYPRVLDFQRFRAIADSVGAYLMVDMAHFAGLVAGGAHPSPVPYADVVTLTTHKTLRGPWGGMILSPEEHAKAIDKAVFPGAQGGPLVHAIAGKAAALRAWGQPEMEGYAQRVVANAQRLAQGLLQEGLRLVSGGTDNHLMLIDLRPLGLTGKAVQEVFDRARITVNRNSIPFDEASKFNPSGIRLGTPAITTRGMGLEQMDEIAALISRTIHNLGDGAVEREVAARARILCEAFPLPYR